MNPDSRIAPHIASARKAIDEARAAKLATTPTKPKPVDESEPVIDENYETEPF